MGGTMSCRNACDFKIRYDALGGPGWWIPAKQTLSQDDVGLIWYSTRAHGPGTVTNFDSGFFGSGKDGYLDGLVNTGGGSGGFIAGSLLGLVFGQLENVFLEKNTVEGNNTYLGTKLEGVYGSNKMVVYSIGIHENSRKTYKLVIDYDKGQQSITIPLPTITNARSYSITPPVNFTVVLDDKIKFKIKLNIKDKQGNVVDSRIVDGIQEINYEFSGDAAPYCIEYFCEENDEVRKSKFFLKNEEEIGLKYVNVFSGEYNGDLAMKYTKSGSPRSCVIVNGGKSYVERIGYNEEGEIVDAPMKFKLFQRVYYANSGDFSERGFALVNLAFETFSEIGSTEEDCSEKWSIKVVIENLTKYVENEEISMEHKGFYVHLLELAKNFNSV